MADQEIVIELRGGYRLDQLDRLLEQLDPLFAVGTPSVIRVDLSGLVFIGAASLALLVATIRDLDVRALVAPGSTYVKPDNSLVARYLARMNVERLLVHPVPAEAFVRRDEHGFRPCQRFASAADLGPLADSLTGAVVEACRPNPRAQAAIWYALNEAAQNVIEHASSPSGGIGVAQHSSTNKEFEIAIADRGVGIRASLARNPDYAVEDDLTAIRLAMVPGVSANTGTVGGIGLFLMQMLLRENRGRLIVRSGSASVESGRNELSAVDVPGLPGTLIALRARIDRPLDLPTASRAIVRPSTPLPVLKT